MAGKDHVTAGMMAKPGPARVTEKVTVKVRERRAGTGRGRG